MRYFVVILALALTACVSAGVRVDQSRLAEFKKGKTTESDIIAALGSPTMTSVDSTGEKSLIYSFTSAQPRPESFIPYVGPLVGGSDAETTNVMFFLNKRGVMKHYTSSQSRIGVGTGFQGMSQPRNADQPRRAE